MASQGGLWRRLKRRRSIARDNQAVPDSLRKYLQGWVAQRIGVEAWLEPATGLNRPSLLLVSWDGEWTRRSVPSIEWARDFTSSLGVVSHDAGVVGYPQRMRDWDQRHKRDARHSRHDESAK